MVVNAQFTISGKLVNNNNEPLIFSLVKLTPTQNAVYTNENGAFEFTNVKNGSYTIVASSLGFQDFNKAVIVNNQNIVGLSFQLQPSSTEIGPVEIELKSKEEKKEEEAFTVTSIDTKKFENQNKDINEILDKSAGVRIRQDGGLGSNANFSLNGLSGKQVKFFIDGVPMDNFGSSLSLNNLPVNLVDNIEIYKGVVPIYLGADALGGAVNIITKKNIRNYVDASYSIGSFNTHRAAVLARVKNKNGVFFNSRDLFKYLLPEIDTSINNTPCP